MCVSDMFDNNVLYDVLNVACMAGKLTVVTVSYARQVTGSTLFFNGEHVERTT